MPRMLWRHWVQQQFPLWRIAHTSDKLELEYQLKRWLQYLVPPGYQIVPPGSVVLNEEEAESCAEACRYNATRWGSGPVYARYRALAAKLGVRHERRLAQK